MARNITGRGQWKAALSEFDKALSIQPEHFWAHCLSAICDLQLSEPIPAKAELNACLQTEKGFAWPYELRGFASYQVAALEKLAAEKLPDKRSICCVRRHRGSSGRPKRITARRSKF